MVLKNNVKNIDSLFENEEFKENIFNIYFIEGIEKGKEEGIKEGIEKWKNDAKLEILIKIFNDNKKDLNEIFNIVIEKDEKFETNEINQIFRWYFRYQTFAWI